MGRAWAREVLDALADGADAALFDPWLSRLEALGPTPQAGPLGHDWLLPRAGDAGGQLALNLFAHGEPARAAILEAAHATAEALGGAAAESLRSLPTGRWHGGPALLAGRAKLKLYAEDDLGALSERLGLPLEGVSSIGLDVTARGIERARVYRPASEIAPPGGIAARWLALPRRPSVSHRVVAALDGLEPKRSYDHVFGPEASLDDLRTVASDVQDLGPPSCVDAALLGRLEAIAARHGLVVRPVAYETDVLGDGRAVTDALVTLSRPGRPGPKR